MENLEAEFSIPEPPERFPYDGTYADVTAWLEASPNHYWKGEPYAKARYLIGLGEDDNGLRPDVWPTNATAKHVAAGEDVRQADPEDTDQVLAYYLHLRERLSSLPHAGEKSGGRVKENPQR